MLAAERLGPSEVRALARLARVKRERGGVKALTEYQTDPLAFLTDRLGVERRTLVWSENEGYGDHEWDGDRDPFVHALEALADWKNVGIESATGTGKTYTLACIVYWFLASWEDALVVTAAPKEDQLLDKVWKEMERLWPRFERLFPSARLMDGGEVRMLEGASRTWRAFAQVTGVREGEEIATKAQGDHAEHMLIITEETPGIRRAVMRAYENTRTAPHNLQISVGNPDHEEDELHRFALQADVASFRVSALDHPNVVCEDPTIVPGAVSRPAVVRRKLLYAHMPAMLASRVHGRCPKKAVGVALDFDAGAHLKAWDDASLREAVEEKDWRLWAAVDLGHWRTAFGIGLSDRAGRLHVVDELFTHDPDTDALAREIVDRLTRLGWTDDPLRVVTDEKSPHDVSELNRAFDRIGAEDLRAVAVVPADKQRTASVRRLNDLLGRRQLTIRRRIGEDQTWRLGLSKSNQGEPREGSRLLWEIRNWRYPEPKEGRAQTDDPDDDTADGADMIAMLRYLVMSWWRKADYALPEPVEEPNRDYGLERFLERREKLTKRRQRASRKGLRRGFRPGGNGR